MYGGHRRSRRVLVHDLGRAAALSDRDRGERDGLDAADRGRDRWARLDAQRRQRRDRADRGGRPARAARVPIRVTKTVRAFLGGRSEASGIALDPDDIETTVAEARHRSPGSSSRHCGTPPTDDAPAGYKHNVIPGRAEAYVDGRFLPGHEDEFLPSSMRLLGPRIRREVVSLDIALETEFAGDLVDAMAAALRPRTPALGHPVLRVRGNRCKASSSARDPVLRVHPVATAAGSGLRRHVPRGRRTGPSRRPSVRHRVLDRFLDLA